MGMADKINQYWEKGKNAEIESQDGQKKVKIRDGIDWIIAEANRAEAEQRQNTRTIEKDDRE